MYEMIQWIIYYIKELRRNACAVTAAEATMFFSFRLLLFLAFFFFFLSTTRKHLFSFISTLSLRRWLWYLCCFECLFLYRPVMTFCSKFKTSFENTEQVLYMLYSFRRLLYGYLRCIARMNLNLYKQYLNRTHSRQQTHSRSRDSLLCA